MKSVMLTKEQLQKLSKIYQINEYVVAREYFQLLFLKEFYSNNFSNKVFFKGGTCIRLIYGGSRFSEDLDFTVELEEKEFENQIIKYLNAMVKKYPLSFKEKDAIIGKSYLVTINTDFLKQEVYVKLDFSFREKALKPEKRIVRDNEYPIVFGSFVYCLSKDEILAEKIRAVLTREKSRDIYDIWMLLELGGELKKGVIREKLDYYNKEYSVAEIIDRIENQSRLDFIRDLNAFIPINERDKLGEFLEYIKEYILKKLT
jgi:predicted nucleotidyltransferase component of viral defense system